MAEPDTERAPGAQTKEIVVPARADAGQLAMSPARSALAVLGGVVVYWFTLSLFMGMTAALFPSAFPLEGDSGPTQAGLVAILVGELVNGLVAGLIAARFAGRAPMTHAAALAGLLGLYAMTTMDQVRGMPGWFALGFALTGPVAVLIGGALAARVLRREAAVRSAAIAAAAS